MKSRSLFSVGCFLLLASACSAPRGGGASGGSAVCSTAGVPGVRFASSSGSVSAAAGRALPTKFRAYEVAQSDWKAFAEKVRERGAGEVTGLALPLPGGCTTFSMTVSSTMPPEMQAKYPDIVSMRGSAADGAELRLDWNGTEVQGQITSRGGTFFLTPYPTAGQRIYLIYHKDDAPATKQPFE